ncbi:MAG TPA: hypothetical protein VFE06_14565 [Acidobacteriaceae bacterium]|jgi:hypothetical protein|nr:hypothetical protein [Acidobacteriaceae bacterium]
MLSCNRESELLDLLRSGGWPLAVDPELHAHVKACRRCTEVLLVKPALQALRADAAAAARLPDAGILWWRAQIRRRSDAVERVNRPLAGAQGFALGMGALTLIVMVVTQARHGLNWLAWSSILQDSSSAITEPLRWLGAHSTNLLLVVPALATLALLGGMAAWLAIERDSRNS